MGRSAAVRVVRQDKQAAVWREGDVAQAAQLPREVGLCRRFAVEGTERGGFKDDVGVTMTNELKAMIDFCYIFQLRE